MGSGGGARGGISCLFFIVMVAVDNCLSFHLMGTPLRLAKGLPVSAMHKTVMVANADSVQPERRHVVRLLGESIGFALLGAQTTFAVDLENYSGPNPRAYVVRGMERFRRGKVSESIADFDKAIELDQNEAGLLWQRGLSLYYADRFEDAASELLHSFLVSCFPIKPWAWSTQSKRRRSLSALLSDVALCQHC